MTPTLPASSRKCCGSRLRTAAHQRPSGRSHSTRNDPSTITSPTLTGSRTQISPGIHGADQHPERNHSPPERLTQDPVQISSTRERGRLNASFSSDATASHYSGRQASGARVLYRPGERGARLAWALVWAADDRAGLLATGCPERYAPGARCVPGPKEASHGFRWNRLASQALKRRRHRSGRR